MSEIDVDFQTETFELDDEASEIYTSDFEWSGGEGSVKLNVDSIVGTMDAEVTVTPDSDDPEKGDGEEQTQRCWKFNDAETEHGVTLPIDADFEVKTHKEFIQVNFYEEDAVEIQKCSEHMEDYVYDSCTYATSMVLVSR